jgi:hypothetical protein
MTTVVTRDYRNDGESRPSITLYRRTITLLRRILRVG